MLLQGEVVSNHDELMSNFFAQADALALGKTPIELRSENVRIIFRRYPSSRRLFGPCGPHQPVGGLRSTRCVPLLHQNAPDTILIASHSCSVLAEPDRALPDGGAASTRCSFHPSCALAEPRWSCLMVVCASSIRSRTR